MYTLEQLRKEREMGFEDISVSIVELESLLTEGKRMSDYKGHTHGEYDDTCPICYLDAEIDRLRAEVGQLKAERSYLKRWLLDTGTTTAQKITTALDNLSTAPNRQETTDVG